MNIKTLRLHWAVTGGRAFFDWLVDLPWKRVSIWGFVVLSAYQLKDFFGVSFPSLSKKQLSILFAWDVLR